MSQPVFGKFGSTLSTAIESEFFRFFHLIEAGSEPEQGARVVTYRPQAAQFRDLVAVKLSVDAGGGIRAAQLTLSRRFIEDATNAPFARDIAKSFIADSVSDHDRRPEVADLVQAIWRPQKMAAIPPGLRVYAGLGDTYSTPVDADRLRLANQQKHGERSLVISVGPVGPEEAGELQ
jgi:hypothetical protein